MVAKSQQRTHGVELVERQLAVENLPAGQSPATLQVERGQHLARDDGLGEARRVLLERGRDEVAEAIALSVPGRTP